MEQSKFVDQNGRIFQIDVKGGREAREART